MSGISDYILNEKIYNNENTVVYRGKRVKDNLPVIIKRLNNEHPDLTHIFRIKHEFEINQMINNSSVVKIYEINESDNLPFLITEDFGGDSLHLLIKKQKFTIKEFLNIAIKIVQSLSDIHNAKIVHNDINPSNIIMNTKTGNVKITDFGMATMLEIDNRNMDSFHEINGTLSYISPEQTGRMNRSIDYRTDFYSLGVTFYELLLGTLPFSAEDELGLIYCHLAKQPIPPHHLQSEIPEVVSNIVMKLMEKMVENRYRSAEGLKSDLEECLERFEKNSTIDIFELGKNDVSDRFIIVQKLYGRESEIKNLLSSFESKSINSTKIISVSGYSGIGKTSFVNELRKSILKHRGFFAIGKYDQLNRSTSYSALIQVFDEILHELLSGSKEQLANWKNIFLEHLGENCKIIIDIIPSLELIVGIQPEVPILPPTEASNRFNFVFQNFVKCFCLNNRPLTIFLDDIHWCDLASLKLIERLMLDSEKKYLVIILSYRDNEVSRAHLLMLTLDNLKKSGVKIIPIKLEPLKLSHICDLLSDTFHCDFDKITSLAELCLKKTEGNPFFLNQFLQLLYKENLIRFDSVKRIWNWDLNLIDNAGITDNVVALMIRKISKLNPEVQKLLTLAACIGNRFNLKTVSIVSEKNIEETYNLLEKASLDGLIIIEENASEADIRWHFAHDRIQQAAYSFIEDAHKKELHLKLGRLLRSSTQNPYSNEKLFDILNHYNHGIYLINDLKEKKELAELELTAGIKAKNSIAYDVACNYFQCGIYLLDNNSWEEQYNLILCLHIEAAEAYYLRGNFESMMKIISNAYEQGKTIIDKINIQKVLLQAYASQGKISEAIDVAIKCFKLLGFNLKRNPGKAEIILKIIQTKISLKVRNIDNICDLPLIKDENLLSLLSIIATVGSICYRTDPIFLSYIVTEAIQILLKNGNSTEAPYLYGAYGMILCSIGDINTGYAIGTLSLRLLETLDAKEHKSKILFLHNGFISLWKESLGDVIPIFKEGYECGLDVGDFEFSGYNGYSYCNNSFHAGKNLEELEKEILFFIQGIKKTKQYLPLYLTEILGQAVYNLRGKSEHTTMLSGEIYDEIKMLPVHLKDKDSSAASYLYILKLALCFLFEHYEDATLNITLAEKYIDSVKSSIQIPIYYFYASLNELARATNLSNIEQMKIIKNVALNQNKMKKFASHAPMNYLNKYYLVEAEKFRVLKKDLKAIDYYNKAIEFSNKYKFTQEEALANELAAKFYIAKGNLRLGKFYIEEAHYLYMLWGAIAKTKQIEKKYRSVFYSDFETKRINSVNKLYFESTTGTREKTIALDAATIIKSTQAISGEIILEDLLKKLTYILIENAGAQKVIYLIKENNDYFIEAVGFAEESKIEVLQGCALNKYDNIPKGVVNYVIHSKELIILDRNSFDEKFTNDPYILAYKPKSILCMPILRKAEVTGVIYLENNLIEGAFIKDRVEILKVISSQLAISMENANIYKNLELLNNSLEQKVKERTLELNELLIKVYSLLDNSGEGFLTFDSNFIIDPEYSSECFKIFSKDIAGFNVLNLLFPNNSDILSTFSMSISMILEAKDEFKKNVLISLLPPLIIINKRCIKIKYKILDNLKVMLILTDVTHEKELEEKVKEEKDRLKLIVASFTNTDDILELVNSFSLFIDAGFKTILQWNVGFDEKLSEIYRSIHTFKGSFSQFNFISLPKELQKLESELSALKKAEADFENRILAIFEKSECKFAFESDIKIIIDILGQNFFDKTTKIFIEETEAIKLEKAVTVISEKFTDREDNDLSEAMEIMNTLRYNNIKEMLGIYTDYTYNLAEKMGKSIYKFKIEGSDIKVDPNRFSAFIKSLIHVFRNAVDHGLETLDERFESGKSDLGKITCIVEKRNMFISIVIEDDGKGIDLQKIKDKAIENRLIDHDVLSCLTDAQLVDLIFTDSFSTKDSINELSGRGYGLSAVMMETKKLNGTIQVDTSLGRGTKFIFTFLDKEEV
jgi:predicted ATPase/GAF domain-containing protein